MNVDIDTYILQDQLPPPTKWVPRRGPIRIIQPILTSKVEGDDVFKHTHQVEP